MIEVLNGIDKYYSSVLLVWLVSMLVISFLRKDVLGEKERKRLEQQGSSVFLSQKSLSFYYFSIKPFVHLSLLLKLTPSVITMLSLCFVLAASILLYYNFLGLSLAFYLLAGVADVVDGAVARATGKESLAGEVLDSTVDRYVDFFMFLPLVLMFHQSLGALTIILLAIHGSFMISYTTAKAQLLKVDISRGSAKRSDRYFIFCVGLGITSLVKLFDEGFNAISVLSPLFAAVAVIAIGSNVSSVLRIRELYKRLS